ncbi:MAG: Gfo/Idh/MocA family protein [Candidatus Rokuibacteriota bacterium]
MKNLRIGVVGCGRWGRNIIRTLVELARSHPVELVAIVNTGGAESTRIVREQFGLECRSDLLPALDALDAVCIVVPDESHAALARIALEKDLHVFVEKPIAGTLAETDALLDLARSRAVRLTVGHLLVFHPCIDAIHERLWRLGQRPRAIFSSRLATFPRRAGKTVLRSSLVHDIAIVDAFLACLPLEVHARGFPPPMRDSEHLDVLLRYGGVTVHLVGSSIWPEAQRVFLLWTESHCFIFDNRENDLRVYRSTGEAYTLEERLAPPGAPLTLELMNFIQSISGSAELRVGPDHIRRVMQTIDLIESHGAGVPS